MGLRQPDTLSTHKQLSTHNQHSTAIFGLTNPKANPLKTTTTNFRKTNITGQTQSFTEGQGQCWPQEGDIFENFENHRQNVRNSVEKLERPGLEHQSAMGIVDSKYHQLKNTNTPDQTFNLL
jgi:hypothetical protein